ncbi:MAG: acetyl-CoA decarbonylase/synthase complex subunit gamma, partial [bacterium]
MKLTGLQIFKLLPNKNCKECGFQTCLAFAMKLAAKQAKLDACPYVSDEAKAKLGAAAAPPIRLVEIGVGEHAVRVGEELVMFRHEKTFFHKTALACQVDDSMERSDLLAKLDRTLSFSMERAGERLALDLIAVKEKSGNQEKFAETVKTVLEKCPLPLVLLSKNIPCIGAALEIAGSSRPLLWGADGSNADEMAALAKKHSVPLVVEARGGIDDLAALAGRVEQAGASDILLAPLSSGASKRLRDFTLLRRRALSRSVPGTGFPLIMSARGGDYSGVAAAAGGICKYASIIVIEEPAPWEYLPLLTLRQNIYTDPQKPLQ